jgi:hypothetical protein
VLLRTPAFPRSFSPSRRSRADWLARARKFPKARIRRVHSSRRSRARRKITAVPSSGLTFAFDPQSPHQSLRSFSILIAPQKTQGSGGREPFQLCDGSQHRVRPTTRLAPKIAPTGTGTPSQRGQTRRLSARSRVRTRRGKREIARAPGDWIPRGAPAVRTSARKPRPSIAARSAAPCAPQQQQACASNAFIDVPTSVWSASSSPMLTRRPPVLPLLHQQRGAVDGKSTFIHATRLKRGLAWLLGRGRWRD